MSGEMTRAEQWREMARNRQPSPEMRDAMALLFSIKPSIFGASAAAQEIGKMVQSAESFRRLVAQSVGLTMVKSLEIKQSFAAIAGQFILPHTGINQAEAVKEISGVDVRPAEPLAEQVSAEAYVPEIEMPRTKLPERICLREGEPCGAKGYYIKANERGDYIVLRYFRSGGQHEHRHELNDFIKTLQREAAQERARYERNKSRPPRVFKVKSDKIH